MRYAYMFLTLLFLNGCPAPMAAHTAQYRGGSEAEGKLLAESRRDVYPNDVRKSPEAYQKATLAWPGIVLSAGQDQIDPAIAEVTIEHHYWDWMEDHSIQKAKAFLSPRGEGQFVCHAERRTIPPVELKGAMAVAYVRPLGIKNEILHAACIVRFFPPDWYATDVMDYGRDGEGLKLLRIPMQ